ncbi:HNH endonuclease [Dickeya undicola]|uniref:HNH endonuclease n=1 Tax=Dickeya undicola TaxID=1577887 RepID=A0ABX9X0D1_9GAMM|nr:HNH endonuclease [Dickeya undicola]RNM26725.1 HNH endonuclease [Dickeya undicola]
MEEKQRVGWSDEELKASVAAYVSMKQKRQAGEKFAKKAIYDDLAGRFGRTAKSFEFRMQNISSVYQDMGRDWLPGLTPATNVGTKISQRIEVFINELDPIGELTDQQFEAQVSRLLTQGVKAKPMGNVAPAQKVREATVISRDPLVKAYVLQQSNGVCECCASPAPFQLTDGRPYLEVHHLKPLAEGGSDTVENAVALCPNCHRALHYAVNKDVLREGMYQALSRLIKE